MDLNISDVNLLSTHALDPLFWRPSRVGYDSAWSGHVPFAFWLVASSQPRLLVELGTHHGVSYSAFCDAVLREHLDTKCYAIDTWKGDPHAGEYGEEVFTELQQFHDAHFGSFSELMRCTFDEAVDFFQDGTIDLLHIDGFHTYEAVKSDFEKWRPKCSDRAIILFHDTNERSGAFGVWKFFAELAETYPHFEFLHQHGLGLIMLGTQPPPAVAALCYSSDRGAVNTIRERFALLGERWHLELRVRVLEAQSKHLENHQNELRAYIGSLQTEADNLRGLERAQSDALRAGEQAQSEALRTVEQAQSDALGQAARENEIALRSIEMLRTEIDALRAGEQAQSTALGQAAGERDDALRSTETLRMELETSRADLQRAEGAIAAEREMRLRAAERAAAARKDASELRSWLAANPPGRADGAESQGRLQESQPQKSRSEPARVALPASYRLPAPIRSAARRAPGFRRLARGTTKIAWWGVTLQLPRRLAARRAIIADAPVIVNSGLFDAAWYLARNPDVASRGIEPLFHYLAHGAAENRDPSPRFSTKRYVETTPGLLKASRNPLAHYIRHHPGGQGNIGPAQAALASPRRTQHGAPQGLAPTPSTAFVPMLPLGRMIYVSGEPNTPGHIYRALHYAAAAASIGIESLVFRLENALSGLPPLQPQDTVVIWRASWDETVATVIMKARDAGARLVFDLDDVVINPDLAQPHIIDGIRSQGIPEHLVQEQFQRFRQTMLACDFCTAPTEALAREVRLFHKACFVLPNTFDDRAYAVSRLAARRNAATMNDGLVRIGYASGSKTHQKDFLLVADLIAAALRARPNCRLVMFRAGSATNPLVDLSEYPALAGLEAQVEWRELVKLAELPSELARFDINIAPLEVGNRFCEAKSELKFFEAAIAGVCTIASSTSPFRAAIRHGETGFVAANQAEWATSLNRLLDDPLLRREMARRARHAALVQFGPIAARKALATLFDCARGGEPAARAFHLELATLASKPENPVAVPASRQVFVSDRLGQADVTVIIPLYNYAGYVIEALDSVRAQTLQPLDLIVVDDCSTDDSLQRAVAWATKNANRFNRILVLQNERNSGLGPTRNVAFDAAETMYVLPLDADNRLLAECCERLLAKLAGTGASFAYPTIRKFGKSNGLIGPSAFLAKRFSGEPFIDAMALVRTDAWASVRGYADMRAGWEDYDFWCRLSEQGLWGVGCDVVLAEYRVHERSMLATTTDQLNNKRRLLGDFEQQHPWVHVVNRPDAEAGKTEIWTAEPAPMAVTSKATAPMVAAIVETPKAAAFASPTAMPLRPDLHALLPILRCPVSHQPLVIAQDGTLKTEDGSQSWPIINGRPILFPGMPDPAIMPENHLSNALEDDALRLIDATDGLVLNLSAGGTAKANAKVVEVEAAVFRNTSLVADSHKLPFVDESFGAVIAMNAFEHYHDPFGAAREIMRVLRPGGTVLIRTAFLQPLHEKPWHFFNCTKYGLLEWFQEFELGQIHVSSNFTANHSISWLLSEAEQALRQDVSDEAASAFVQAPIGRFVDLWRDEAKRSDQLWTMFTKLGADSQEALAAGFEYRGRKPLMPPHAHNPG